MFMKIAEDILVFRVFASVCDCHSSVIEWGAETDVTGGWALFCQAQFLPPSRSEP
jgi:hypothetical protein